MRIEQFYFWVKDKYTEFHPLAFTNIFNVNFFRQIITTKENTEKWLDEAYKGCEQTHYKFVDEGSQQDGPMVMKRKRSRVILTPDEREQISNFLAENK